MNEHDELYRRYRPTKFSEVVGQDESIRMLTEMGKSGKIPHALLFTGPSGTGKTTLGRILRKKIGCIDADYIETNAADFRGIDTIREMARNSSAAPLGGKCRVWFIDEVHQLTSQAQDAFLKLLEDTHRHVYFMLGTTDPQKLKNTIITRCTQIRCKELSEDDLKKVVTRVCEAEGKELDESVLKRLVEASSGSARKALVILHAIIDLGSKEEQLSAIQSEDERSQAIEICRGLMNPKTTWKDMQEVLKTVEEDPEAIRWMILGYAKKVLLGNGNHSRAALIIENFRDHFYDSKHAGLVVSCWNVMVGG